MDTKKEGDQPSLSAFKGITLEAIRQALLYRSNRQPFYRPK